MSTVIDLMGSFFIGGLVLLMILTAQSTLVQNAHERTMDLVVQGNMTTLVEILQYDVRKMGFGVPDSVDAVLAADSTSVTFLADLEADGSVDTVVYSVSDASGASGTENPRDRLFFRQVNGGTPGGINLCVTEFRLTYRDATGSETTVLTQIRSVEIALTVESVYAYDDRYAMTMWEGVFRPRNLDL